MLVQTKSGSGSERQRCPVTPCSVTYVIPPFLKKLSPSALQALWSVIHLKIPPWSFPLVPISVLNNAYATPFFEVQIANPISMRNEQVGTFPAGSQCLLLPELLHFDHRFTSNQAFKSLFPFSSRIGPFLLLLCLPHIEQNLLMDAGDQSNLLHELLCSSLHIRSVINLGSQ